MDICRAFDLFEMVCLVISILVLLIAFVLLITNWKKTSKEIKKDIPKQIINTIIIIFIWLAVFFAYDYIKSMFC